MNKFVYMDAAAGWLKPQPMVEFQSGFLRDSYANAGRGVCARAGHVDELIALSRKKVADFIGTMPENIVFTSGATDAFNRIVHIIKNTFDGKKLTVAVSDLDHHSARLPWEMSGENIVVIPLDNNFNIDIGNIPNADVYVITAMSNVLGVAQNIKQIITKIKSKNSNAITIVDAAQFVVHNKIDIKNLNTDFLAFSGHKIGSDTGIGVMCIKNPDAWKVDKFGGGMVNRVLDDRVILNKSPEKFEAGTLPITQIVGLPYAIDYCKSWNGGGDLIRYMYDELSKMENIKLLTLRDSVMISFVPKNLHVLDFGVMMGARGICLRVGNMCASWIHKKLGVDGSCRLSVGPWNTMDDAIYVVDVIKKLVG